MKKLKHIKLYEEFVQLYEMNVFVNIRQYFENLVDEIKKWFMSGEFSKPDENNRQCTLISMDTNQTPESMIRYLLVVFETTDGYRYQLQISLDMKNVDQATGKFDKLDIELKKYDSSTTQMLRPWMETINVDQLTDTYVIGIIGKLSEESIDNRGGDRPTIEDANQVEAELP